MLIPSLSNGTVKVDTTLDSVVIVDNFQSIRGGRSLDMTGFTPDTIKAGHVIIRSTATGDYKPMPLNGGATAYAALPADHTYAGILIASLLKTRPFAGIMVRGTVNKVASPFDVSGIVSAITTALPGIIFTQD